MYKEYICKMKNKKHDRRLTQGRTPEQGERNEKVVTITVGLFTIFLLLFLTSPVLVYGTWNKWKTHPISKGGISLQSKIKEHMTETEKITKLLKSFKEGNQTLKGSSIMEEMIIKYTTLLSKMKHK